MAELVDIASVQDLLPAEAAEEGWNEEKITTYLDGGKTVYQVVLQYWESITGRLYTMIDVSESGSSRSLSRLYDNAKAQAEYWRDRIKAEKDEEIQEENDRITTFGKITRV